MKGQKAPASLERPPSMERCVAMAKHRSMDSLPEWSKGVDSSSTGAKKKKKYSAAGNGTRVFRVTGGNTNHYTTAESALCFVCAAIWGAERCLGALFRVLSVRGEKFDEIRD